MIENILDLSALVGALTVIFGAVTGIAVWLYKVLISNPNESKREVEIHKREIQRRDEADERNEALINTLSPINDSIKLLTQKIDGLENHDSELFKIADVNVQDIGDLKKTTNDQGRRIFVLETKTGIKTKETNNEN